MGYKVIEWLEAAMMMPEVHSLDVIVVCDSSEKTIKVDHSDFFRNLSIYPVIEAPEKYREQGYVAGYVDDSKDVYLFKG